MENGIVKWFREDLTGYIVASDGEQFYFDGSVVFGDARSLVGMGASVTFTRRNILGNMCAIDVRRV